MVVINHVLLWKHHASIELCLVDQAEFEKYLSAECGLSCLGRTHQEYTAMA